MKRSVVPVLVLYDEETGQKGYYVGDYWEGGMTGIHAGPFSTEEQAWEWIDAVKEDKGYFP